MSDFTRSGYSTVLAVRKNQGGWRNYRTALVLLVIFLYTIGAAAAAKLGGGLAQQLATAGAADQLEVIVTFQGDTVSAGQIASVKALGISHGLVMQALPIMGVLATPAQINGLAQLSGVRSLWANQQLRYFNYETRNLTGVERVRTDPVMIQRNNGIPYSGAGVTVEVNDTGIDATHSDLQFGTHVIQNVQGATNLHALDDMLPITYLENQQDTDTAGHGTHVAGTVGGTGARSGGKYAGAAPGANLVGYGSGAVIFVLDGVGGFDYAIVHQPQQRTRVITNSFGAIDPTFDPDDPLVVAGYEAYKHGMVVVFAAGNEGPGVDTLNPYCKAPWVVCVAASNKQGQLSEFSSRGLQGDSTNFTEEGTNWTLLNQPTITAPGEYIISTRATGETNSYIAGEAGADVDAAMIEPAYLPFYTVLTGTSQATPHVAGIIALMLEANPKLGPLEVKSILQQTATNMPGRAVWEAGAGLVNAYAAVDRAARTTAAYGKTVNTQRSFNSSVNVQITKSTFSIDYNPIASQSATGNTYTFTVPPNTTQVVVNAQALGVQNGVQDTGNPIDMFLIAPDGTQYESAVPVAFSLYTGRSVLAEAPQPGQWQVYLQALVQEQGVDVSTVPETVNGLIFINQASGTSGLSDVTGTNDPNAAAIEMAVGNRLMDGLPGGVFRPYDDLLRIDLANYLAMGNLVRQYLPITGVPTFSDVSGASATAFAESVAAQGAATRDMFFQARGVMLPTGPGLFSPTDSVHRYELAYSLVQSLGQESQALQQNGQQVTVVYQGQRIPVDDAGQIPAGYAGYVQLALDLNLMNAYFSLVQGPFDLQPTIHATFRPAQVVPRVEYAVAADRFLAAFQAQ